MKNGIAFLALMTGLLACAEQVVGPVGPDETGPPEQPPPPPTAASITLSASRLSIMQWQEIELIWSSTGCNGMLTASGAWSGERQSSGTEPITPLEDSKYRLKCLWSGGQAEDSATVVVIPESIMVTPLCGSSVGSVVLEPALGGFEMECKASVRSATRGDVTDISVYIWTSDGLSAGEGKESMVWVHANRPNPTSSNICVRATLGSVETSACQTINIRPRYRGEIFLADGRNGGRLNGALVIRQSQANPVQGVSVIDTAVVSAEKEFYFRGSTATIFKFQFEPFTFSASATFHPAKSMDWVSVSVGKEIGVLAVPYRYCLISGLYAGQCPAIDLIAAHARMPPPHNQSYYVWWISYFPQNPITSKPAYRDIPSTPYILWIDRLGGTLQIALEDSASIKGYYDRMEARAGETVFVPIDANPPANLPIFRVRRFLATAENPSSYAVPNPDGSCHILLVFNPSWGYDDVKREISTIHETMHCLGLGHMPERSDGTCPWPGPMTYCRGYPQSEWYLFDNLSSNDVAHHRLLRTNVILRKEGRIQVGIEDAWEYMKSNIAPFLF
jgi:hypothetical protein